jgi:hypothetical protein
MEEEEEKGRKGGEMEYRRAKKRDDRGKGRWMLV